MAPYIYRQPYTSLYHSSPWWYYRGAEDIEKKYIYSLSRTYFPYDRYDYRFSSYPRSYLNYGSIYAPGSAIWGSDLYPRSSYSAYESIHRPYSPVPVGPVSSYPLRRSRSYSELDDYLAKKEAALYTPMSSYLYPDGKSLSKRSPSFENLTSPSTPSTPRARTADLYDMGKHVRLDPTFWTIWYNPVLHRSPVMFRRRLAYFIK